MMGLKTLPFDPSDHLETAEDILFYLEAAMEGNDPRHIASALGDVARSKGMSDIARKTGLRRQALYNALSENANPTLETLPAVLDALGLLLTVQPKAARKISAAPLPQPAAENRSAAGARHPTQ